MASILAENDILKIRVYCRVSAKNQTAINTYYTKVTNPGGSPTVVNIAPVLSTGMSGVYKPLLATDAGYSGLDLQKISPTREAPFFTSSGAGAGNATGNTTGMQVASIIHCFSDLFALTVAGKYKVPSNRCFIPFPPTSAFTTNGSMTNAYFNSLLNLVNLVYNARTAFATGANVTLIPQIRYTLSDASKGVTSVVRGGGSALWATMKKRGERSRENNFA